LPADIHNFLYFFSMITHKWYHESGSN